MWKIVCVILAQADPINSLRLALCKIGRWKPDLLSLKYLRHPQIDKSSFPLHFSIHLLLCRCSDSVVAFAFCHPSRHICVPPFSKGPKKADSESR